MVTWLVYLKKGFSCLYLWVLINIITVFKVSYIDSLWSNSYHYLLVKYFHYNIKNSFLFYPAKLNSPQLLIATASLPLLYGPQGIYSHLVIKLSWFCPHSSFYVNLLSSQHSFLWTCLELFLTSFLLNSQPSTVYSAFVYHTEF